MAAPRPTAELRRNVALDLVTDADAARRCEYFGAEISKIRPKAVWVGYFAEAITPGHFKLHETAQTVHRHTGHDRLPFNASFSPKENIGRHCPVS